LTNNPSCTNQSINTNNDIGSIHTEGLLESVVAHTTGSAIATVSIAGVGGEERELAEASLIVVECQGATSSSGGKEGRTSNNN
jgi:hypothetical protein